MKGYEKPFVLRNEELSEGIYTASGSSSESGDLEKHCRFGKKNVNVRSAACKKCVSSGGTSVSNQPSDQVPGHMTITADQCPDQMPPK